MTSETRHDNLLLTLGECKHPSQGRNCLAWSKELEGGEKMKQGMEDQSPVTEKPTRKDTALLGLRENNVIYIATDSNKCYYPYLQTWRKSTNRWITETRRTETQYKEPMLGTESLFTIMQNVASYSVLLKQCPKNPLTQAAPIRKSTWEWKKKEQERQWAKQWDWNPTVG